MPHTSAGQEVLLSKSKLQRRTLQQLNSACISNKVQRKEDAAYGPKQLQKRDA